MKFGLSEEQAQFLFRRLIDPIKAQGFRVYIFGSRAKGKHHPFSDIDILVDDVELGRPPTGVSLALEEMENSNFPFKVDFVYLSHLADSYRDDVMATRKAL